MLTPRQSELLVFIDNFTHSKGYGPSFHDMSVAMGLKSKGSVHRLITALEDRGFVRRHRSRARAVEVVRLRPGDMPRYQMHGRGDFPERAFLEKRGLWYRYQGIGADGTDIAYVREDVARASRAEAINALRAIVERIEPTFEGSVDGDYMGGAIYHSSPEIAAARAVVAKADQETANANVASAGSADTSSVKV